MNPYKTEAEVEAERQSNNGTKVVLWIFAVDATIIVAGLIGYSLGWF